MLFKGLNHTFFLSPPLRSTYNVRLLHPKQSEFIFYDAFASLNLKVFVFGYFIFLNTVCEKNYRILCTDTRPVGL